MSKQPKPYYRKFTESWYFSTGGKQVNLGKDKAAAFKKFHELMASVRSVQATITTVYDLSQAYLAWCQDNRASGTFENQKRYLKTFIAAIGKRLKISDLRKHHVLNWSVGCGSTTSQNDAISVVQRMFNWAIQHEYLDQSPIAKIQKPRRKRREIVYTAEQWVLIKGAATGSLVELLDFMWSTGCRPKEVRTLEARHVHDDLVIFPPDESKGKTDSRVIFLTPQARAILEPLLDKEGPLFTNSRGVPWTKDALVQRCTRISTKVGFRVIAYGARHSYCTNALIRSVDTVSLSHLMGHKSTRMVSNYAHLIQNVDFLKAQAKNASGS